MVHIEKKTRERKEPLYYAQITSDLSFGFTLTASQLEELYIEISNHLFNNLLEQNKDLLVRLKNNVPAPKKVDADEVIGWLNHRELRYDDVVTTVIPDSSPTSISHKVKWLSDEFIKKFKKDFGL